jgi:uncharacterized damage-inducible protein DinB
MECMTPKAPEAHLAEPWLRGPVPGLHPLLAPLVYSFQQAREDLAEHTRSLSPPQLYARPYGFGSVAFHLRHIAGSVERLMTYVRGEGLTAAQVAAMSIEKESNGPAREELLAALDGAFTNAEAVLRGIDPATLAEPRSVGRKQLPTTVIGLVTHIAEHTQRHVGQAIAAAKLAKATEGGGADFSPGFPV